MAGTIIIKRDIASTGQGYTGGGNNTSVTLQVIGFDMSTKRNALSIQVPKSAGSTKYNDQTPDNRIYDLKRNQDTMSISGWLEDDASETAWNKYWKLRAMVTRGGPLKTASGQYGLDFKDSSGTSYLYFPYTWTDGGSTQQIYNAWLDSISGTVEPTDALSIYDRVSSSSTLTGVARIKITLNISFGMKLGGT